MNITIQAFLLLIALVSFITAILYLLPVLFYAIEVYFDWVIDRMHRIDEEKRLRVLEEKKRMEEYERQGKGSS